MKNEDQPIGSRDDMIQISVVFLREVKDMTTGAEMETWLNEKYGEESQLYRDLARLITAGADEDWAENLEVGGLSYRRSRILAAAPETFQFRLTAVYQNSSQDQPFKEAEEHESTAVTTPAHPR